MTTKEQAKQFANWIWPDKNTAVRTFTCGSYCSIVERDENGNAIGELTPLYGSIRELLVYLQGYWTATIRARK